jgi:hypothetical protein
MALNKTQLIVAISALTSDYSENDLKAMKVTELADLLKDVKTELANAEPEVDAAGQIVIPEQVVVAEVEVAAKPAKVAKEKAERGPTKRDALFAVFDKVHAAGETNFKEAAMLESPESSAGVVSSYLCYWRADRSVAPVRAEKKEAAGLTNAEKARKALTKIYGEDFVLADVIADIQNLPKLEVVAEETQAE